MGSIMDVERVARISTKLERLWSLRPDQRLGQLLVNLIRHDLPNTICVDMLYFNDERIEEIIDDQTLLETERLSTVSRGRS